MGIWDQIKAKLPSATRAYIVEAANTYISANDGRSPKEQDAVNYGGAILDKLLYLPENLPVQEMNGRGWPPSDIVYLFVLEACVGRLEDGDLVTASGQLSPEGVGFESIANDCLFRLQAQYRLSEQEYLDYRTRLAGTIDPG